MNIMSPHTMINFVCRLDCVDAKILNSQGKVYSSSSSLTNFQVYIRNDYVIKFFLGKDLSHLVLKKYIYLRRLEVE